MTHKKVFMTGCLTLALCGCFDSENSLNDMQTNENKGLTGIARGVNTLLPANEEILTLRAAPNPDRNAYFGDLHVHTAYSFDAYVFGTVSSPDDAYRYAKRQALDHPSETFPDSMTLIENAAFFDNSVLTSPVSLRDFGIFSPATFTVTPKLASITYAQGAAGRNDVTFTPSTGPTGSVTAEAAAPPATATPVTVSQLASLGIMAILLSLVTVRKPAS